MLVLCIVVGLSVEDLSEIGGPFLGINDLTFHRAVHPGDTLRARSTVVEARASQSRPATGIVTWHTEGLNQARRAGRRLPAHEPRRQSPTIEGA